MAVFSTDVERPVATIIAQFVRRWNIEVTFEETRRHLGVEPSVNGRTRPLPAPRRLYSPCFPWCV